MFSYHLVTMFSDAFPQSWESVRNSDDYLHGEGRAILNQ